MDAPRRLSVLVVDDHPDTAESTADLCRLYGYSVQFALDGEDALHAAEDDPPDVVLLDIRMPGLDGCEVARRLAARPGAKPPLLVAVTAGETAEDRSRSRAAGFHLHLVKPVSAATLVGLLRRVERAVFGSAIVGVEDPHPGVLSS